MKPSLMIMCCALLVGLCGAQATPVPSFSGKPAVAAEYPLSDDLELRDSNGKVQRLSALRGTPVILNFWATWCPPCRRELPWLVGIQKQYGSQGLRIVGISMDEAENSAVAASVAEARINYLLLFGSMESSLSYLGARGFPVTLYIGRDGKLRHKTFGIATQQELVKYAQELLE